MSITRRTKERRRWQAWSGELGDLNRVVSMVESLADQRRSEVLKIATSDERGEWPITQWKEAAPLVKVRFLEGTDSVTGAPQEALAELDRRTIRSLEIFADFPGIDEELKVEFLKGDAYDSYGVQLRVESASQGWAKQSLAQLSDEIEKSVPRWAYFLSALGRLVLLFAIWAAIFVAVIFVGARHVHRDFGAFIGVSAALLFVLMMPIVIVGMESLTRIFPRFEIYGEGGTSTGGRRWAALIAIAITIPIGVLVNLIS